MNWKIRKAVFETNSSSTHSIVLSHTDIEKPDKLPIEAHVCTIYPDNFGWEIHKYKDAATKASYALTYAYFTGHKNKLAMLRKVVKKFTGAKKVIFAQKDDIYWPKGYIDHQSLEHGVPAEAFVSEETLAQFIFNRKSILITDNDNH